MLEIASSLIVPLLAAILTFRLVATVRESRSEEPLEIRAAKIHREALVVDTHSDTTLKLVDPDWDFMVRHDEGHMDHPRILEGGLNAVFLAIYMGRQRPEERAGMVARVLGYFDRIHRLAERHPRRLGLARTAEDVRRLKAEGRTALLIGVEGGAPHRQPPRGASELRTARRPVHDVDPFLPPRLGRLGGHGPGGRCPRAMAGSPISAGG